MSNDSIIVNFSFQLIIRAIDALDNYYLSLKINTPKITISRDHSTLKSKLRGAVISLNKPKKLYSIKLSIRELSYLRKIVFQNFIALLRESIHENRNEYHELYKMINSILGKEIDEIQKIKDQIDI